MDLFDHCNLQHFLKLLLIYVCFPVYGHSYRNIMLICRTCSCCCCCYFNRNYNVMLMQIKMFSFWCGLGSFRFFFYFLYIFTLISCLIRNVRNTTQHNFDVDFDDCCETKPLQQVKAKVMARRKFNLWLLSI